MEHSPLLEVECDRVLNDAINLKKKTTCVVFKKRMKT